MDTIKTSDLISNFEFENGNPDVEQTIVEDANQIIIILEGVAEKIFPKPDDFEDYVKQLAGLS